MEPWKGREGEGMEERERMGRERDTHPVVKVRGAAPCSGLSPSCC